MQFVEGSRETHRKVPGAFRCTHKLACHACIWAGLGWAGLGWACTTAAGTRWSLRHDRRPGPTRPAL